MGGIALWYANNAPYALTADCASARHPLLARVCVSMVYSHLVAQRIYITGFKDFMLMERNITR